MDRRTVGAALAAGLLLCAAVLIALIRSNKRIVESEPSPGLTTAAATQETTTDTAGTTAAQTYIIGAWEDKLAVFIPPDTAPYQLFDIYLDTLPMEEQQKIREGIIVNDERTLASLLEDYTS
jgi:hypothetical protein